MVESAPEIWSAMDLIWAALVLAAVVAMTVLALSKVVDPRRSG